MRVVRFWIFYFLKLLQRYWAEIGITLGILLIVIFVLTKFHEQWFKPSVSEGLVGTYTQTELPNVVTALLSQNLVDLDQQGLPHPGLAQSWQVSSDAKQYTFKLKPNLHWTNGTPVKASDMAISVEDSQITAPDDQTIVIKLNDSFSPLPALLAKPVLKKGTEMGVGPYHISDVETSSVFVQKLTLDSDDLNLPKVVVRFYPNEHSALDAIKIGEVQSVLGLSDQGDLVGQVPFKQISKVNYSRLVTIFYNTGDKVLTDKNLRLALSFAAPSIKDETVAITSIPPTSWAFNPDVRDYLDNPSQAKLYLSKVKDLKKDQVILTTTSALEGVGKEVVSAWNAMGINASLKVESGIPQNFQALLIAQDIPTDPDQYSLWQSTQTETNISKISSPRIDKDLEEGRKVTDINKRKSDYEDFQKVLLDESPATFLYFPQYHVTYLKKAESDLKKVLNIQLTPFNY